MGDAMRLADAQIALLVLPDRDHNISIDLFVFHQLCELVGVAHGRLEAG
jgi:hypothetical protein